jgi:transcriptional regulator with XRE-family HTH domain
MNEVATRIFKLLNEKGMNRGLFAQKAGISPAVLSHIASGRNAPSLDLVLAMLRLFPEIDLNWLLLGKGNMYQNEKNDAAGIEDLPKERVPGTVVQPELFQVQIPINSPQTLQTQPEHTPDYQLLSRKIEELKFLVHLHTKNTADSIAQLEAEVERIKGI